MKSCSEILTMCYKLSFLMTEFSLALFCYLCSLAVERSYSSRQIPCRTNAVQDTTAGKMIPAALMVLVISASSLSSSPVIVHQIVILRAFSLAFELIFAAHDPLIFFLLCIFL